MEVQDSGASKMNLLVQNACAALQDHRGNAIGELDKAFEEHSKWLTQAFKESRKRLRMDEVVAADSREESPKSRVCNENGVLSERDPNVGLENSTNTSNADPPKPAPGARRLSPRITRPESMSPSAEVPPAAAVDQYQEAKDKAKAYCDGLKFRELQKEIKARGHLCKGATDALRERLYSLMVEDILLKEPAVVAAEPPKENVVPAPVAEAAASTDAPRVLSPMHTSAAANVDAAAPEEAPASAVKGKSNVFGKLLSGGKKFLRTKRTPGKSATKPTAKSASRPLNGSPSNSSPKSAGSSDAAPMEPPSPTPFSIAAAVDDNEPVVEPEKVAEVEEAAVPAEAAPEAAPEPVAESAVGESPTEQQNETEESSAPETQTQMEEDQVQEEEAAPPLPQEAPAVTVTATAEPSAPTSPEAPEAPASPNMMESSMMESPQKPTLGSVVRMSTAPSTAADILAAAQSTYKEPAPPVASPTHDDMEMSVMMSPVAAAVATSLPPQKAPSPVAKAPETKAPPVAEAPAPTSVPAPATATANPPAPAPTAAHPAPAKPVSTAQQQQQAVASAAAAAVAAKSSKPSSALAFSGPGLVSKSSAPAHAEKKIPANMSTKPSSHALKLEQIREKQRLATLQKEKELAEKQAERDKRMQEHKVKALSEKLAQKQASKTPADTSRSEKSPHAFSSSAAAPATAPKFAAAPAVAAKPAASVLTPKSTNVPTPAAPAAAPKPAAPTAIPALATTSKTSELSKMERNAEEEAQRLVAQSAAARAAAEEYDSYCMSEPEEQEEDNSDEETQRGKAAKRVPDWATKENLRAALKQQCERKIDPDGIFYECNTCILEDIFERSSKRYQKRTSSANWNDDKMSIYEKLVYKRSVGIQDM